MSGREACARRGAHPASRGARRLVDEASLAAGSGEKSRTTITRRDAERRFNFYLLCITMTSLAGALISSIFIEHSEAITIQQQLQPQQQQQAQQQQQQQQPTGLCGPQTSRPGNLYQESNRTREKWIVDEILNNMYDKRIRPAGLYNASNPESDGPTIVYVNFYVRSISKIDDVTMEYSVQLTARQEWVDDRLAFNKTDCKKFGLSKITLTEHEKIWKPDLFFRNEKEGHFHKIIMPNVLLRISGYGEVLYSIRISLVLACPMDLKYYPLDKQNCTIEMASYGYQDVDLKFLWKDTKDVVQIPQDLELPRFKLHTHYTAYCTSKTSTGSYSCLRVDLVFKREFSYYLIQIYIPCCMLVIVSWVSFWLDPNAIPARVSLGVTTLLTMATQISGINASLPPVSYTKAIDVWTGVCLTFVFGALLEFALVNYASRSDQHKREMLAALTQTQQMRWREAAAAAAAAGVAPPTEPPPDENSPSMLMHKQAGGQPMAFFPPLGTFGCPTTQCASSTDPLSGGAAPDQLAGLYPKACHPNGPRHQPALTLGNDNHHCQQTTKRIGPASSAPAPTINSKITPHTSSALQYLRLPRNVHMATTGSSCSQPRRKNWCKMWLAKFPTRSKRIDVISRIFFPLKFALFNLVYWTTYLFREEDKVPYSDSRLQVPSVNLSRPIE